MAKIFKEIVLCIRMVKTHELKRGRIISWLEAFFMRGDQPIISQEPSISSEPRVHKGVYYDSQGNIHVDLSAEEIRHISHLAYQDLERKYGKNWMIEESLRPYCK